MRTDTKKLIPALVLSCLALSGARAGEKLAFLVGNASYANYVDLKNPGNDVEGISRQLASLGFEVSTLVDARQSDFEERLLAFCSRLRGNPEAIGLFYYAGHAVQAEGINYLIPVDANIPSASFLRSRAVSLQIILDELGAAKNKANIVVLDACRNNPFAWSRDLTRGLAVVRAQPAGSVVVYATNDNNVALDGEGANSVFAGALLRHLRDGGDFDSIIDATAREVIAASGGKQTPAVYKQNFEKIYFTDAASIAPRPAGMAGSAAPKESEPQGARQKTAKPTFGEAPIALSARYSVYGNTSYSGKSPSVSLSLDGRKDVRDWLYLVAQLQYERFNGWADAGRFMGSGYDAYLQSFNAFFGAGAKYGMGAFTPYIDVQVGAGVKWLRGSDEVAVYLNSGELEYATAKYDYSTLQLALNPNIGLDLSITRKLALNLGFSLHYFFAETKEFNVLDYIDNSNINGIADWLSFVNPTYDDVETNIGVGLTYRMR